MPQTSQGLTACQGLTVRFASIILHGMTFKQAVKALGGPSGAAKASGIARTVIIYWLKNGVSRFRKADGEMIVALAEQFKR